jgi:ABC-type multidrug transport system ATPase subunit
MEPSKYTQLSKTILDEPTNGLDPQGIADIRQLIKSLSKDQGKTVLVSSHLLSEIEQIATHILIIHQGKKMAEGPTSSLLDPNKTIVQIKTLDDADAKQKLMASAYSTNLLERTEGLYLTIPKLEIPALNTFIVASNIDLVSLEAKNSFEDYFLQLTSTF